MNFISFLHIFFVALILISSILLVLSKNPVYSVLLLILAFFGSASSLILFGVDFMGLLFIIIYVGAIAVLFLFVVMMLDLKLEIYNIYNNILYFFITLICCPIIFSLIYNSSFLAVFNNSFISLPSFSSSLDSFFNIDIFGQTLYNYFIPCFLIAGLILLVAMLGAIILTLKFRSNRKNELAFKQLSRKDEFLSYFN